MRARLPVLLWMALAAAVAGCSGDEDAASSLSEQSPDGDPARRAPIVTIGADQKLSPVPAWRAPEIEVDPDNVRQLKMDAAAAQEAGELFGNPTDAIPLLLALRESAPDDPEVETALDAAVVALIAQGDAALDMIGTDPGALRRAHEVAAVARELAPSTKNVVEYLIRLDHADQALQANQRGEAALNARRILADGKGEADTGEIADDTPVEGPAEGSAVAYFREALQLRPGDARALQGLAASESALIRFAELAADRDDYAGAEHWLDLAGTVRPHMEAVADARQRIARHRASRVGNLRDLGLAALTRANGIDEARGHLASLLRIAPPGDPAAIELREQIELTSHYGLFRPGQAFTEGLGRGGRGPEMVVVPHGAFRMGATADEPGSSDAERPSRNIRFDRGLAVSRNEITVGEFRRFVTATGYQSRATRQGYSTVYDERSGNLVRRGGVDWRSDYTGNPAGDGLPVIHVSAQDAANYAHWLAEQTGQSYRLPSEAEFEYMLRAGSTGPFPWGEGRPPAGAGNFTGARDQSPGGRHWRNAFEGYGDDAWGPARVGSYSPNAYGLHDVAGNVSEWVADCWHDSYRRAPVDGTAWVNPGCEDKVVRGGSWASSPTQTRSAWRLGSDADTTNGRVGFRVVRDI